MAWIRNIYIRVNSKRQEVRCSGDHTAAVVSVLAAPGGKAIVGFPIVTGVNNRRFAPVSVESQIWNVKIGADNTFLISELFKLYKALNINSVFKLPIKLGLDLIV